MMYQKIGHHGIGNFRSSIETHDDISKAIPLIQKVYRSKKRKISKAKDILVVGWSTSRPHTLQLNPIEISWRILKDMLAGRYFESTGNLVSAITNLIDSGQMRPVKLMKCLAY